MVQNVLYTDHVLDEQSYLDVHVIQLSLQLLIFPDELADIPEVCVPGVQQVHMYFLKVAKLVSHPGNN